LAAVSTSAAAPQTLYSCGPGSGTGDGLGRGFYVTGYPGSDLHQVTLNYQGTVAGSHTIGLTAHLGTYDGPVIGSASATGSLPTSGFTPLTFTFSDPAVATGSTLAFVQVATSLPPGSTAFYEFTSGPCPGVFETEGTTPPLDSKRFGRGVAVTITGNPPAPSVPAPARPTGHKKKCKKRHKSGKKAAAARKHCKRHKHRGA
jgi:hypothetical protein